MTTSVVLGRQPLGFPWPTIDPFLFCVHHLDDYPAGNDALGPDASLAGRTIGMDFDGVDGWRMYHGDVVPGFPRHPHRGFETVTVARSGYIDHSDSMGATARFGHGDAQWMTAGAGIVHSEMFPLVEREQRNPTELFQIWLNLPRADKLVEPHFAMLWASAIPVHALDGVEVVTVAGALAGEPTPSPPPHSWASRPDADVAIWTIRMQPGAAWTIPAARAGTDRVAYFFAGNTVRIGDRDIAAHGAVQVRGDADIGLVNGDAPTELLLLQGRPIGEPVAHRGPFVMNAPGELKQAFDDYQRTGFGGWPWDRDDPVHDRDETRFAIHAGGRKARPE